MESFQTTYTHQHIYVEDTSVTLVCLVPKPQDMDFIVSIINNIITQLKRDLQPERETSHEGESVPNPDETFQNNLMLNESSQSPAKTSVGGKESSKFKKITMCPQNSVLLWILNILNLKNSLRQITNNLDVDIDEEEGEIFIHGSKELVQKLKSVLRTEDKKVIFVHLELTISISSYISSLIVLKYLYLSITR